MANPWKKVLEVSLGPADFAKSSVIALNDAIKKVGTGYLQENAESTALVNPNRRRKYRIILARLDD